MESGPERLVLCNIQSADSPRVLFSLIIAADFTWTLKVAGQKVCLSKCTWVAICYMSV